MENENFNPEQSLQVINGMISNAKNKLADDGFLLIFWGWLVIIAAVSHYITIKLHIPYGHFAWIILMPLGGIFSAIYGSRKNKKQKVKTYIDSYLSYLWIAFGISLFIALGFIGVHGIKATYFFLMILYGIATMVSGGLLNFKPLVIGSIASFACAAISVFLSEVDQLLIIAVAILFSYLVPGYLLRNKFKSQQHV